MSEILIYNLDGQADAKLKMLCRKLLLNARSITKEEYGYTLGRLLGLSEDDEIRPGEDFSEPMLYICGMNGGMLNIFLNQLRRNKLVIPLKAVQTESNLAMTSYELYRELSAEREAITKGCQAHQNS